VEDVEHCRGKARVIAINDAHRLAPWADVLYAADARWWEHYAGVPEFGGMKYAMQQKAARWPGVTVLQNTGERGVERNPCGLRSGRHSGYQAMGLAVHLGASRVILLGYDMQRIHGKGRSHWFGDHPKPLAADPPYQTLIDLFETAVEPMQRLGIAVLNCSRETALTVFPRVPLAEALASCEVAA
jgi:hypothetical protein